MLQFNQQVFVKNGSNTCSAFLQTIELSTEIKKMKHDFKIDTKDNE